MLEIITPRELPTVLLIDDDMVSREVMATMLTMSGYAVHTAADGEAALALLAGAECTPGVILMDVQMPGLSGLPLIQQLRARCPARLYVISASGTPEEVIAAADGFILKPFPPEALTRMIEEHETQLRPPAAPGLDPEETVVNPETLAQLREMMPETAVRQIFEAILADLGRRIAALKAAIAKEDWPETRRIGHAIKGGGSMAGAVQLARLGAAIESGSLDPAVNQLDNSSVILADLQSAAANLRRMLDAEFKAQKTPDAGG
ncbi:MAG TPA: response regulator [Terracidiphilus sp.]|nr:response regulator [Terracidiphilus sp.]